MKRHPLHVISLAAALCFSPARAADDHPDIHAVVESFRISIIQKDRERFLALFVQPDQPWQSVLDDKSLAQVRPSDPGR
ncbi:hypothetical protein LVB87_03150 [Lysobacter sp. KIS68-7]|uniref:hypothetical protein n=1 Tax=Lysobacter sp. KIS68-7 TaxID=2904252 RepID=UPI001E4C2527|nr:hypothetical protein [Lysobacter sp. KIS68-7]UHQ20173.1 hypothetical protein LVB87_03150 [Lysobacter sp. KIS68-7]